MTRPTNEHLRRLIITLEKTKTPVWKHVAYELSRSRRRRTCVNVGEICKKAPSEKTIIVPGKVLGGGDVTKKITVVAWSFTPEAEKKIKAAGGEAIRIEDYIDKNKNGKNTVIIK